MRDLIVTQNITLDGVIDMTGGWADAYPRDDAGDMLAVEREHRAGADAVLVGRKTFEAFRGYWPKQQDDATGVSDYLNRTQKFVVSSTLAEPDWMNSTVLRGNVADEVRLLKNAAGKAIVATGSIQLVHELVRSTLVDEYRLFVYPVVVGEGRRLFDGAARVPSLRLIEARSFSNGIALMRYRTR